MRHSMVVEPSFPLTLTLSLPPSRRAEAPLRGDGGGEREQPAPGACFAHTGLANSVACMAQRLRTILPLTKGEGRGFATPITPAPMTT